MKLNPNIYITNLLLVLDASDIENIPKSIIVCGGKTANEKLVMSNVQVNSNKAVIKLVEKQDKVDFVLCSLPVYLEFQLNTFIIND